MSDTTKKYGPTPKAKSGIRLTMVNENGARSWVAIGGKGERRIVGKGGEVKVEVVKEATPAQYEILYKVNKLTKLVQLNDK